MNKNNLQNNIKRTALALFSGGLDSILAVKLIQRQGINVIPVCFESPFFGSKKAKHIAKKMEIKINITRLKEDYLEIIRNPRFGYGKNLNPCIDCHAFMFKKLGNMMDKFKADFLISGEVLGQRPKSQSKIGMATVAKNSDYKDLIVTTIISKIVAGHKTNSRRLA